MNIQSNKSKLNNWQILWKSLRLIALVYDDKAKGDTKEMFYFKVRRLIFLVCAPCIVIFGLVMFGTHYEKSATPFPAFEQLHADSGTLERVATQRSVVFLLFKGDDGKQIWFNNEYRALQDMYGFRHGDVIKVKVWWFPLKHANYAQIAQLEVHEARVLSYQEAKENFIIDTDIGKDPWLYFILVMNMPIFIVWVWEFLIQYKVNKQGEN